MLQWILCKQQDKLQLLREIYCIILHFVSSYQLSKQRATAKYEWCNWYFLIVNVC